MRLRAVVLYLCLVLAATALAQFHRPIRNGHVSSKIESAGIRQAANLRVVGTYGKRPLSFEANQGQTDSEVRFLSRGKGYSLFLTSNEAVLSLQSRDREGATTTPHLEDQFGRLASARGSGWLFRERWGEPEGPAGRGRVPHGPNPNRDRKGAVLRMKLVGANRSPRVTGLEELPGKSNYFIGNDPAKWRTNVPTYAKVRYENVYSGIDLVYYGNQRQLEYDFVVAPGADSRAIRLAIQSRDGEGAAPLRIDGQGDLVLEAEGSELRLHQPVIYQEISGARQSVDGKFVLQEEHQVGFQVASYDGSKPLIIDPVLSYSTYLGGSGTDYGNGIAVDSQGNAYVVGRTTSVDFPTASPFPAVPLRGGFGGGNGDAFVAKFDSQGRLVFSTYLGGNGYDEGSDVAADPAGSVYVTGSAGPNFPTANAFQAAYGGGDADVFVTKLNAAGSALVYSTYVGGSGDDGGFGIAVDSSGNACVTGLTASTNFPTASAFQAAYGGGGTDAFVTKLNAAGSALVYSTYLGGYNSEYAAGIAVDSTGNAYVTGQTSLTKYENVSVSSFPTTPGAFQTRFGGGSYDAFVAKLNASGTALVYSSFLGGNGNDFGTGIAVDSSGTAYVTGNTASIDLSVSNDFPTVNALQPKPGFFSDAFVTKLNAAGSALVYSTYLGGNGNDSGQGIAVDSSGNAYVTGWTGSTNFPTANPVQAALRGNGDVFVAKLNAAGSALIYSTYLGGSGANMGEGIAVDSSGNAYLTGYTLSSNFPTGPGAFQAAFGGNADAFVVKLSDLIPGAPILPPNSVVNAASFQPPTGPNGAIAPGAIVSIFGTGLASTTQMASGGPLPTTLGDATVTFNNTPAPLFFVSPGQINVQVPFEVPPGTASVQVKRAVGSSEPQLVSVAGVSPGIFTANRQGTGPGAILHAGDFKLVSDSAPARPGEFLSIYCTGLGRLRNAVASGTIAPSPAPETLSLPQVNIGGIPAQVAFSGLAPGFVGLYQVNVQVPSNALTGDTVPAVLNIGGVTSNTVTIAVR